MTVAILGCAGYTGQETLDRVLNHPELELVALGSDSQAGQPAIALDPRLCRNGALPALVTNAEAAASGADLFFWCLSNERAAALDPPADGRRRRPLRRAPDRRHVALSAVVRLRAPAARGAGRLVLRAARAAAADRAADREPRAATRPPRSSRSRRSRDVVDPASVVVDAKSGVSGAGRMPSETTLAGLGAREPQAVLDRPPPARARDRADARLRARVRPAPAADPARAARDLLRGRRLGRLRARPARGGVRRAPPVVHVLPEGVVPEIERVVHTDARRDRRLRRPAERPHDRDRRRGQPRQGRRRPGDAEREPRPRPARDRRACGSTG